jgi:hypothetical protein
VAQSVVVLPGDGDRDVADTVESALAALSEETKATEPGVGNAQLEYPFPAEIITGTIVTRHELGSFRVVEIWTEVTNRERLDGISLSFAAFYYFGDPEERLTLPPLPQDRSSFPIPDDVPRSPGRIDVAPTKSKTVNLVFMWYTDWDKTLAEKGIDKPLSAVGALRLEVTDHVSGKTIEMGAVSRYPEPL